MNIYFITEYWSKENQHKELNKGVKKKYLKDWYLN